MSHSLAQGEATCDPNNMGHGDKQGKGDIFMALFLADACCFCKYGVNSQRLFTFSSTTLSNALQCQYCHI